MSILAFIVGLALPSLSGWLLVRLCEGNTPVLGRIERWAAGATLGITLSMWLVFLLHVTVGVPLDRIGFLATECGILGVLGGLWCWKSGSATSYAEIPSFPTNNPKHRWEIFVWILLAFAVAKIIIASVTFLLLTPTYVDDALDNWNLRGKVFFVDHALTLIMPGEDPINSPKTVSSYPPTVPLFKASLASIAGTWTDALVNSVHIVWFILAAILLYCAIRRRLPRAWALLGTYAYLAMPLATMHGTNPYADVFVSVHVFLAALWTFEALTETDPTRQRSRFLLLGLALGALTFTKNEGTVLYLPPLILILVIAAIVRLRQRTWNMSEMLHAALRAAIPLILIALPWLIFKWSHGLTFGNAKSVSELSVYWRTNVLTAVAVNTFFEGNWLLLFPLFFGLLVWRWRAAWQTYIVLTAFIVIVYVGQLLIFLFTDLATEALMQTGYARGLIQLLPCIALVTTLLLADATRYSTDRG